MAEKTINSRIIHKHDVEANWLKAINFIPQQGEIIIYDIDTNYNYERFKIGDGQTLVNNLPFINAVQADWNQNDATQIDYIKNKPAIVGMAGVGLNAEVFNNGIPSQASGEYAHAEGHETIASGDYSHSEGQGTIANKNEHAQGVYNIQSELVTHYIESVERQVGGGEFNSYTTYYRVLSDIRYDESMECYVFDDYEELSNNFKIKAGDIIPIGIHSDNPYACDAYYYIIEADIVDANDYNICDVYKYTTSKVERSKYAHVVGNGTSDDSRSNAHTLDWNGNAWFSGDVYINSTSGTNKDDGSKKLATEEYVNNIGANEEEIIDSLISMDMLPAVSDMEGNILTDENDAILLI